MKPVITLPLDKTPNASESDDSSQEDNGPTGDIAELTQRVQSSAVTQNDSQGSARVRVFMTKKPKNKGVGKGQSGSSGPPAPPKRKPVATVVRAPAPSTSNSDDSSSSDNDDDVGAVQQITVKSKRGYTHYPAYIFDNPPKKLKTDTLCKKLMISEIKRSETQTEFYERAMVLMGHVKEFMRNIAMSGGFAKASTSQHEDNEHDYAMQHSEEDEDDHQSNETTQK